MNLLQHFTLHPAFGWPIAGALAVLLLVMAVLCVWMHRARRGHSDETVGACVRRTLLCVLLAMMMLTPSIVTTTTSRAVATTDVLIAVDVTGSMAVRDARYGSQDVISRLQAASDAVDDITAAYPHASFAALRFGASATLDVPLTPDTLAIANWADTLSTEPTSASAGSTLDTPLDTMLLTLKSISEQHPDDRRVVYLISDGEQTASGTRRTFSSLRRYVDNAYVIGVGSPEGGNVPTSTVNLAGDPSSNNSDSWVIDPTTGQPGVSKLDGDTLSAIADEMGGSYLHATATHTAAQAIDSSNEASWRIDNTAKPRVRVVPVVWPWAIAAFLIMMWETAAWIALSRSTL